MTGDVRLRDVVEADLEVFFAQQDDPEANRRASFPARPRDAFMTHWHTRVLGTPTALVQAVVTDGEVAGNIVSWAQDGRRYLGYWLGQAFWGRGIGTVALRLFLGLEQTRPLYAEPHEANTASVKLLERCGFERVGTDDDFLVFALSGPM
jgi:RimJ/RimL family protein N-acetyltransferase